MQLLRSVLFTTWLFVGTLLYAVVVLAFGWLPSTSCTASRAAGPQCICGC